MVERHCACKGLPDSTGFYYITDGIRMIMDHRSEEAERLKFQQLARKPPSCYVLEWQKTSFRGHTLTPRALCLPTRFRSVLTAKPS